MKTEMSQWERDELISKLKLFSIGPSNFSVNDEGLIDVFSGSKNVMSDGLSFSSFKELGLEFGKVKADTFQIVNNHQLTSLTGFPRQCYGNVWVENCPQLESIAELDDCTGFTGLFLVDLPKVKLTQQLVLGNSFLCTGVPGIIDDDLTGISERIAFDGYDGAILTTDFSRIKKGGLGLLLVRKLTNISSTLMPEPFKIIQSWLDRDNPEEYLFDCQEELIKAGYEEYAVL